MNSEASRLEKVVTLYEQYLEKDDLIATNQIPIENINEEKALNDNLAITINAELKKIERKFEYCPLPYITDKLMGEKRVIKNTKTKVTHIIDIKSVDKKNIGTKLSDVFHDIDNLLIMPKYDGVSCICWYNKSQNNLTFATKSNDVEGENITNICNKIVKIDKLLTYFKTHPELIGVRGEIIIDNKYSPKVTRLAELSGLLHSKTPALNMFPYLHIVFYFVYLAIDQVAKQTLFDYLQDLKQMNIEITEIYKRPKNLDIVNENVMAILEEQFNVNYDCDGFIFRENSLEFDASIAIKKAYYFLAKVTSIKFNLKEREGTYVPVLYIEYNDDSIKKNISKINGYNLNYLYLNKIQVDSIINIKYTGDTIAVFDKLLRKGFAKSATFNKYVEYIKFNSTGLEGSTFYNNEFIGKIDYLYNFIEKQKLQGAGSTRIKEYLNAIYPDRIKETCKFNLYKTYLSMLKNNKYSAVYGMSEITMIQFSNGMSYLIKNKKQTLELTVDALSISLLTYSNFNKFYSHLDILLDIETNKIKDISRAYKSTLNVTSQTVLDNKHDLINIYNLFLEF